MNKKGQMTIFIILGIVLILVFGLVYSVYSKSKRTTNTSPEDIDSIKRFSDDCLAAAAKNVISKVHMQGGYYDMTDVKSTYIHNHIVPYYSYDEQISIPTESIIADEISKGIKTEFEPCMAAGIQYYTSIGWNFIYISPIAVETTLKTSTSTGNTAIMIDADYPTRVSRGKSTYTIGKIAYTSDSRIGVFLDAARACTDDWSKSAGWFNMDCLIEDRNYYAISDWQQDSYSYFEYQDIVAQKDNIELFWRFALSP